MNRDWRFTKEEYSCGLRVAGVLVRDGKILVQKDNGGHEYALPGGSVQIGETTEAALIREYQEETGAEIEVKKLLWTEENFWEYNGKKHHGIIFYYLLGLKNKFDIPDNSEFVPHRDNINVVIGWMPISEIENVTIYPVFLKEQISGLDNGILHFVTYS